MNKQSDPRAGYIKISARRFAEDGFHGTSLAAVAKDAGVTKQALLHFFGTKDRLYAEVLTDLSKRLCAEIDDAEHHDPALHLSRYFLDKGSSALNRRNDAKLVVRALLETRENARVWPMKPYLDRLVALVRKTPAGSTMQEEDALAWIFQLIGAIQYFLISSTAVSGMYGRSAHDAATGFFDAAVKQHLKSLSKSPGQH